MNSVALIGRLARDPELSYTQNTQMAVCRMTLAVDRPRRNGEDQGADFIRITVWGKQAENCDRYLAKGRQIAVQGRIQTGSYKDREGKTVYTTDVVADRVEFLGSNNNGQHQETQQTSADLNDIQKNAEDLLMGNQSQMGFDDMPDSFQAAEDDIPF